MPKVTRTSKFRVKASSAATSSKRTATTDSVASKPEIISKESLERTITNSVSSLQSAAAAIAAGSSTVAALASVEKTSSSTTSAPSADQTTRSVKNQKNSVDTTNKQEQGLSRGQRKRLAKREQYLKKERLVLNSLKLKHAEEQMKRIDGLDAIKDALIATLTKDTAKEGEQDNDETSETLEKHVIKTNKARKSLVEKETAQMNLVLQHPRFQADPFATIREHLQNTLTKDAQKNAKEAEKHVKERDEKRQQKKAIKKENGVKKKKRKKFNATRSKGR